MTNEAIKCFCQALGQSLHMKLIQGLSLLPIDCKSSFKRISIWF